MVRGERVVVVGGDVLVGGLVLVGGSVLVGGFVLVEVGVEVVLEVEDERLVGLSVLVREEVVLSSTRRSSTGGGSAGEAATRKPRKRSTGTQSITARTSPSRPVRRRFTAVLRPGTRG